MISVRFTLSSISGALLYWSVNQTLTEENYVFPVFIIVKTCEEIFSNGPNSLLRVKVNNAFDVCW